MSTMRSLKRQRTKARAEKLHRAGKGNTGKLFNILWRGSREAAADREQDKKNDQQIEALLKKARAAAEHKGK